ncbi:MAG: hypothetical protein COC04_00545 [Gammaproteobacteria bacterium]|nr:MAG: hypothetical protein COC04_00545 [Gammaproteobacteria bacterium]
MGQVQNSCLRGELDVFVESEIDPSDAVLYCLLEAEYFGLDNWLTNAGVANALVKFYGCRLPTAHCDEFVELDMAVIRDGDISDEKQFLHNNLSQELKPYLNKKVENVI